MLTHRYPRHDIMSKATHIYAEKKKTWKRDLRSINEIHEACQHKNTHGMTSCQKRHIYMREKKRPVEETYFHEMTYMRHVKT